MEISPVELRYYQTLSRRVPFEEWFDSLDDSVQAQVDRRLNRLKRGMFGDVEPIGDGVFELKLDIGPGYRVYFGRYMKTVVLLLKGGAKKTQSADIATAQGFWKDYLRRKRQWHDA